MWTGQPQQEVGLNKVNEIRDVMVALTGCHAHIVWAALHPQHSGRTRLRTTASAGCKLSQLPRVRGTIHAVGDVLGVTALPIFEPNSRGRRTCLEPSNRGESPSPTLTSGGLHGTPGGLPLLGGDCHGSACGGRLCWAASSMAHCDTLQSLHRTSYLTSLA